MKNGQIKLGKNTHLTKGNINAFKNNFKNREKKGQKVNRQLKNMDHV